MIFDTIKSVALATPGVKAYGHGTRNNANLEPDDFPRIWLYPVIGEEDHVQSGAIASTAYDLMLDCVEFVDFDNVSEVEIDAALRRMWELSRQFIFLLRKEAEVKSPSFKVKKISTMDMPFDDPAVGYILQFKINFVENNISYPCP